MAGVVVVGSANADLVVHVDRRPVGGETVTGSELAVTPGGKGSNQAIAAALMGADVAFLGCVGHDAYGDLLATALAEAGADASGLGRVATPTSVALIILTPDGENSIIVTAGANGQVTPDFLRGCEERWRDAALVVMQLEVPLEAVAFVAGECRARGIRFLLNAAPAAPLDAGVLAACDPLVVNETEAAFLLGADVAEADLVDRLLELGPASVVVTLGAAGAVAGTATGERYARPAEQVERVVDTTGAGDAFVGGLATVLGRGGDLAEGLAHGARAAAVAVQASGAAASYAGMRELR
ncbi:MAG: ribokinase [Propionibacteriaceae bacterium]|nr:ribokinase [Propionibacteriaceae bacterium]